MLWISSPVNKAIKWAVRLAHNQLMNGRGVLSGLALALLRERCSVQLGGS